MQLEYAVEQTVAFGKVLPGAFGSTDLIGKRGNTTVILDWKFGDGVPVSAEENPQLMYYADAARLTPETQWAFEGTTEVELIIVQPPHVRRWTTTFARLDKFRRQLRKAIKISQQPDAPFAVGSHCRFCAAKPLCPMMTGAAERALQVSLEGLDGERIGRLVTQANLVEQWIKDLRELAQTMLENDKPVAGYKLVAKRATRKWIDETVAAKRLQSEFGIEPYVQEVISPAAAEKILKKTKLALPDDLVVAVSSGSTLAPEDDPRPAVLNLGKQLSQALTQIQ